MARQSDFCSPVNEQNDKDGRVTESRVQNSRTFVSGLPVPDRRSILVESFDDRFFTSCGVFGSSNVAFSYGKSPLDRIGSALHQLENRYNDFSPSRRASLLSSISYPHLARDADGAFWRFGESFAPSFASQESVELIEICPGGSGHFPNRARAARAGRSNKNGGYRHENRCNRRGGIRRPYEHSPVGATSRCNGQSKRRGYGRGLTSAIRPMPEPQPTPALGALRQTELRTAK